MNCCEANALNVSVNKLASEV